MKIVVLVKQVPDTETKIRLKGDATGIETGDVKWIISPYDEFAVEEGLKTRDAAPGSTVTVLSVGPDRCVEALRTAVAMGADHAVHVKGDTELDTYQTSKAIAEAVKKVGADLVLAGKQALDDDQAAVFGYTAEFLGMPSTSVVVKIDWSADKQSLRAHREIEGGAKEILEMPTPCLLAVNKGINTPRYASLPGIMKAKKKEIQTLTLADLGLGSEGPRVQLTEFQMPPERQAGKKLAGDASAQVTELVRLLRDEAKVL